MRYERPGFGGFGVGGMVPPVVKMLLITNFAIFVLTYFSTNMLAGYLGLVPRFVWSKLMIWQVVTYMFLHGGWIHLIGNMLFLWVFGDSIEDAMGHVRFIMFYLMCGIFAAFAHILMMPHSDLPLIGASGAVAGVIAAYLILHPKVKVWVLALWRIPIRITAAQSGCHGYFFDKSRKDLAPFGVCGSLFVFDAAPF